MFRSCIAFVCSCRARTCFSLCFLTSSLNITCTKAVVRDTSPFFCLIISSLSHTPSETGKISLNCGTSQYWYSMRASWSPYLGPGGWQLSMLFSFFFSCWFNQWASYDDWPQPLRWSFQTYGLSNNIDRNICIFMWSVPVSMIFYILKGRWRIITFSAGKRNLVSCHMGHKIMFDRIFIYSVYSNKDYTGILSFSA